MSTDNIIIARADELQVNDIIRYMDEELQVLNITEVHDYDHGTALEFEVANAYGSVTTLKLHKPYLIRVIWPATPKKEESKQ